MQAISNAFLSQAEIEDKNRWKHGPLEFMFLDLEKYPQQSHAELVGLMAEWNRGYEGGFCRNGKSVETLERLLPGLIASNNPNIFLAGRDCGFSQLDVMLASVVPSPILEKHGLTKQRANMWLLPFGHHLVSPGYGQACRRAFEEYIWQKLQRSSRCQYNFFAKTSPLRLLAADSHYWMSRLFRIAVDRYEGFSPTEHVEELWQPLEVLRAEFEKSIPTSELDHLEIRRPRMGGELWDIEDEDECDAVVEEMLDGLGIMEPIDPLLDLLHSHRTQEDFSPTYSWIKEDFERSFYSKRAKVKVVLVETVDDHPAWAVGSCIGHDDVIFRDILACFDSREQKLLVAVRHGKTTTEIAKEMGLKGHASISRKLARIKERVRRLLS
jgi:hypothetical protein